MTTIGERLKFIRVSNEYSQTDFASLLNLSVSTYKSYESNKTNIPHNILEELKNKFNFSLDWLVAGIGIFKNIEDILEDYYKGLNKNNYTISQIDVFKRLIQEIAKNDKELKDSIDVALERNNIEQICDILTKYYEGADFHKYYSNNKIPYSIVFFESTYDGSTADWFLYGTWKVNEINDKTSELRSIISFYLNAMSPHALEQLKNKLEELRKIEEDFFK